MSLDSTTSGKKQKKGLFGGILGGGKTYFLLAIVAAIIAAASVMMLLSDSTARVTYYVLGQDIPARTQITESLLVPIEVNADGAPQNAISLADAQTGQLFAQTPMLAGDPVTFSVVGPLERVSVNIPDDFVIASFIADAENAVAGKVRTGDLVDVFTIPDGDEQPTARMILYRALVLDVAVAPKTIASAANSGQEGEGLDPGPESNAARGGIPQVYTVAMRPEDAAKLAATAGSVELFVVLSARSIAPTSDVYTTLPEVFTPGPVADSSAGVNFTEDMGAVKNGQASPGQSEGPVDVPAPVVPSTPVTPEPSVDPSAAPTGEETGGSIIPAPAGSAEATPAE